MTFREFWQRELHVAIHGQTSRFRVVKYLMFLAVFSAVYYFFGPKTLTALLAALFVFAIALHAFLSWKTERWMKSWWLYKGIPLENEP